MMSSVEMNGGAKGDGTQSPSTQTSAVTGSEPRAAAVAASSARLYLILAFLLAVSGLGLIALANRTYAPEMYEQARLGHIADAFSNGQNYAVFDLNINIRQLREEQISRLSLTPNIVILGASQWQEASTDLLPNRHALNAHVHRDYYEDVLGMVELLARHDRLPRDLVITIRDRFFTPVAQRTDNLWLPGVPYYRAMAKRLSLEAHPYWETQPLQRPRELISLSMLFSNATRWHNAAQRPHPTTLNRLQDLDLLLPDGSIRWSDEHRALFTQDRSRKLAIAHADASRNRPPVIDPKGVEAMDTLLAYLGVRGVKVHLAHPPFNPIYFDQLQDSPYIEGLRQVEAITRELAAKHKLGLVGSYDPADLACTADMFIDAEHANANCLSRLMADIADSIDLPTVVPSLQHVAEKGPGAVRAHRALVATGWSTAESREFEADGKPDPDSEGVPVAVAPETFAAAPAAVADPAPLVVTVRQPVILRAPRTTVPKIAQPEPRPRRRVASIPRTPRAQAPKPARVPSLSKRHATAATRGLVWPGDPVNTYR